MADDLADLATAVTKVSYAIVWCSYNNSLSCCVQAVFRVSGPSCSNDDCDSVEAGIDASKELIRDVLDCFLVNSSCDRFRSVFISSIANRSLSKCFLHCYYIPQSFHCVLLSSIFSIVKICDSQHCF